MIITTLLISIVGGFKALADLSSEGKIYPKSKDWKNKWATPLTINTDRPWYYLWLYKPHYKERFPYSSTFLVSQTDFWHKTQTAIIVTVLIAILTYTPTLRKELEFIILYSAYAIGFTLTYETIKRKL